MAENKDVPLSYIAHTLSDRLWADSQQPQTSDQAPSISPRAGWVGVSSSKRPGLLRPNFIAKAELNKAMEQAVKDFRHKKFQARKVKPMNGLGGFGQIEAPDTAKNVLSNELLDVENRDANKQDPQSIYLSAKKIQETLTSYAKFSSSWGPVSLGGYFSWDDINNRCQVILTKYADQAKSTSVQKAVETTKVMIMEKDLPPPPPAPSLPDPNSLVPDDEKIRISQAVYGSRFTLPVDPSGNVTSYSPTGLTVSPDDGTQSVEKAGTPEGPSPQRIYELEQVVASVKDRPWTNKSYVWSFGANDYVAYQTLVEAINKAKAAIGLTPDKLNVATLISDVQTLQEALKGVDVDGRWSVGGAFWASGATKVAKQQAVLANIQGRMNVGLRIGAFTDAELEPVRTLISGAKTEDGEGRTGGVMSEMTAKTVEASKEGQSVVEVVETVAAVQGAAKCVGLTGDELIECCNQYTESGKDRSNCIGTTGAANCAGKTGDDLKQCCASLPMQDARTQTICQTGGLSLCRFLPDRMEFVCKHWKAFAIGGGILAAIAGVVIVRQSIKVATFGALKRRRKHRK